MGGCSGVEVQSAEVEVDGSAESVAVAVATGHQAKILRIQVFVSYPCSSWQNTDQIAMAPSPFGGSQGGLGGWRRSPPRGGATVTLHPHDFLKTQKVRSVPVDPRRGGQPKRGAGDGSGYTRSRSGLTDQL